MVHLNRTYFFIFFFFLKKDRLSVHSTFFVRLSIWTPASFDTTIHLRVGRFGTRTHIIVLIFRTDLLDFARWWKHSLHKKKISPFCLWISFFLHSSFIFFCYPIMRHMSGQDFSHIFRIWGRYYYFFFSLLLDFHYQSRSRLDCRSWSKTWKFRRDQIIFIFVYNCYNRWQWGRVWNNYGRNVSFKNFGIN